MFDHAFVISLERHADRLLRFYKDFADTPFKREQIHPFRAVDGELTSCPLGWVYREFIPHKVNFYRGEGAWGCYQSHLRIIERLLNQRMYGPTLILEDDAYPVEGFNDKLKVFLEQVPPNWDQLYLGGQHLCEPKWINEHVFQGIAVNRSHAYVVRGKEFLLRLYQVLSNWRSWRNDQYADHAMATLQLDGRWRVYTPNKWLIGQRGGMSTCTLETVPERDWNG